MGCKFSKTTTGTETSLIPIQLSLTTHECAKRCLNQLNRDLWKDGDMSDLLQEYLECNLLTLNFCNSLQTCLKRALTSHLMILLALNNHGKINHEQTLQEFRNFTAAGDPFDNEFLSLFQSLPVKQISMLQKLEGKRRILEGKTKSVKTWRRVSKLIASTVFVGVMVFSIVAAAISAPPVVVALAAAAVVPAGTMIKWLNSFNNKHKKGFKYEMEIVTTMKALTFLSMSDMEGIRINVSRLEIQMEALLQNAEFACKEEEDEGVMMAVEEMKKMMDGLKEAIDDLTKRGDNMNSNLTEARSMIMRKIIRQPLDE